MDRTGCVTLLIRKIMQTTPRPLPEFCYSARPLTDVSAVVIHYFSAAYTAPNRMFDPDICYDLFIDLNHHGSERGMVMPPSGEQRTYASAHYMIDRDGVIYSLVPENRQAYHAKSSKRRCGWLVRRRRKYGWLRMFDAILHVAQFLAWSYLLAWARLYQIEAEVLVGTRPKPSSFANVES